MNKVISWPLALSLSVLLGGNAALAEDIDIYTGLNPESGNVPTVLLVWDNAANNSSNAGDICSRYDDNSGAPSLGTSNAAGMEQCAMVNALLKLRSEQAMLGKVKIGLMVFNKNGFPNNGNGTCGYLRYAPALMDLTGVNDLISHIKAFKSNDIKANSVAVGGTMATAWSMLNGKKDACSGVDFSTYQATATECREAVLVFIGNAFTNSNPKDGGDAGGILKQELTGPFGYAVGSNEYEVFTKPIDVPLLNNSGSTNNDFWADEWTRFMRRVSVLDSVNQADKNITSYTISVTDSANQDQAQPTINYYSEMARQGGGKSFVIDFRDTSGLSTALLSVFNDVQAKNSVFAAATLPVTANTQGTYANQVFVAMFRPDGDALPRWHGNLKQYHLGLDAGNNIVLTDAKQDPDAGSVTSVTNPVTGAVSPDATSFWTTTTPKYPGSDTTVAGWPLSGFWRNSVSGKGLQHDAPDGDLVEKGGAAQMGRVENLTANYKDSSNDNGRNLLTCNSVGGCSKTALPEFSTANSTLLTNAPTLLGVSGATSYTGAKLMVGLNFQVKAASCKAGSSKSCTVFVPFLNGNPGLVAGEVVKNRLLDTTKEASCLLPDLSKNCNLDTVTATDFSYNLSGLQDGSTYVVPEGTYFYRAERDVSVDVGVAHGMSAGDMAILSGCTGNWDSKAVTGFADLPDSAGERYAVTLTKATETTFNFTWKKPAISVVGSNVKCTVEPALTAPNLINWVRGWDIAGNEQMIGPCAPNAGIPQTDAQEPGCAVTVRPSLHGDVLHSRPAVINYGGSTGVVVFYGTNDGVFRAVNGNQQDPITLTDSSGNSRTVRAGGELWGFIAPEFHRKFKRLFQNTPLVDVPGVSDPNKQRKDYFFDGSTTVLRDTRTGATTSGKTIIYLTARRGGRLIYAFDVSDPMKPKFLWSKSNADIPELGQTWSQPKVAILRGRGNPDDPNNPDDVATNPVLIMGAGYAPEQDADPVVAKDSMGRGVVILDAVTGEPIWSALASCTGVAGHCVETPELTHGVAADITLIDRNADGNIDRLYAADLGGNIWRVDLEPKGYGVESLPADWKITKLAALGGSGNDARKFLYPPDVIPTRNFDVIMAVSGDREHPLYTSDTTAGMAYNVQNRIYMLKDTYTGAAISESFVPLTDADLVANPNQSGGFSASDANVDGFYIDFENPGEKGVNAPLTVAGKTYFATNYPDIPKTDSCTADLGFARAYTVEFYTGQLKFSQFVGGGLPPSPVSGLVEIAGKLVPFIIGGAGPTTFDPIIPDIDLNDNRKRAYWYAK